MEKKYDILNLDCAHCGGKIEEAIKSIDGVEDAVLNFPMKTMKIKGNITDEILEEINRIANKIEADVRIVQHSESREKHHSHEHGEDHCCCENEHEHEHGGKALKSELIFFIIGIVIFICAIAVHFVHGEKFAEIGLFVIAYLLMGYNVLIATVKNISKGNFFDENFLMTIATIGAFILGEYEEAVGVMLFFKIGELFEDYAVSRSKKAITDLAQLQVDEAEVLRDGDFIRVDSDEIVTGDILRIKTGERIAVDGIVDNGESRIDTSAVTGESVPVTVRAGDKVMSGCICLSETFTLRATSPASESMIARIAKSVEEASSQKPKIDRFITRFSKVYTPVVIAIAVITAVLGSVITGDIHKWIYSALTFLVISCPCALVLSVPLAYFSGIGASSKLGILFRGGDSIETLGKVKSIVFDKTGTLTNGSFTVTDIKVFGDISKNELLKICGACEQVSTHPVAESITLKCRELGINLNSPKKSGEIAGRGVYAQLDGKSVLCGNEKLMKEKNITIPEIDGDIAGSVVYVAVDGKIIGRIIVSDSAKATSKQAIEQLNEMGIYTAMLTGDKPENAEITGKELNLNYVKGGLLPEDKIRELNRIREEHGAVMFVGDGINDAPVLAGADVGGAMKSGSDIAIEASDAVFMNSDPMSIVFAKKIANKTLAISYQNIIFALAIKVLVIILGLFGHPNMWLAVFADSGTAMLLILNSVRALITKK